MATNFEKYEVANVVFSLQINGLKFPDGPSPFYTPFRTQKEEQIRFIFEKVKKLPALIKNETPLFDSLPSWQLFQTKKGYQLEIYDLQTGKRDRIALINKDFTNIHVSVTKVNWNFQILLRLLLEIVFVNYLAPRAGLLLHAAAVRDHGRGYMFVGHSGAGKTTTTHLWKAQVGDYSILGDERTIIRKLDGEWRVHGTPWPGIGMIVENKSVPLSNAFSIRHGKSNKILDCSKAILFQEIFGQVFSSFWSAEALDQITQTCETLLQEVPCDQLAFVKDESAVKFVQKIAEESKFSSTYETIG